MEERALQGDWQAYRELHARAQHGPPPPEGEETSEELLRAVDLLLEQRDQLVKRLEAKRRAEAREVERQRLLAKAQKLIEQAYQLAKQQEKEEAGG